MGVREGRGCGVAAGNAPEGVPPIGHEFDLGLEVVKQDLTTAVSGMGSRWRHANTHCFFSF